MNIEEEKYIRDKFKTNRIEREPFPHLYVENILPPHIYAEIIAALPSAVQIALLPPMQIKDTTRAFEVRAGAPTSPGLEDMAKVWEQRFKPYTDLVDELTAKMFGPHVRLHRRRMKRRGWSVNDPKAVAGQSMFCFRGPGWEIPPHTHDINQTVQSMIYFPDMPYGDEQGTYLYKRPPFLFDLRLKPFLRTKVRRLLWGKKLLPYRPNTLVSFLNSPRSVHGTKNIEGLAPRRYIFTANSFAGTEFAPWRMKYWF